MGYEVHYYKKEQKLFPEKLQNIHNAPKGIYYMGSMPDPKKPAVAIVGARMCSAYGKKMALSFAQELSEKGVQIISGMAKGVDGFSHQGAINGGTPTFAVMGCGLDHCYPPEHLALREQILENGGGILSEYPLCTPPLREYFPQRNRIISALADLVLVIEAKMRSGSLITADFALEQGRIVYALPGRVGDALSAGCNHLIAQGAGIAASVECILEELHIDKSIGGKGGKKIILASELNIVYSCLDLSPKSIEQLSGELNMPIDILSESLLQLELDGYIEQFGRNQFIRSS